MVVWQERKTQLSELVDLKNWIGCSIRLLPEMARKSGGCPMRGKGGRQCPSSQLHGPNLHYSPPTTSTLRHHCHPTLSPHSKTILVASMTCPPSPSAPLTWSHCSCRLCLLCPGTILLCCHLRCHGQSESWSGAPGQWH